MKVQMLASSVSASPHNQYASSYLINNSVAVDAGPIGLWGEPSQQASIRHIFLTHSHADHIGTLPVFLENSFDPEVPAVVIHGSTATLDALQQHVLNDVVWPDFVRLSRPERPFLKLREIGAEQSVDVEGLRIMPVPVCHNIPTLGYIVTDGRSTVIFGGDSGPTERIWELARTFPEPRTVFLECTFPDSMKFLAELSAHLTPSTFVDEIAKMPKLRTVIAVHLKARFRDKVAAELLSLKIPGLIIGEGESVYDV